MEALVWFFSPLLTWIFGIETTVLQIIITKYFDSHIVLKGLVINYMSKLFQVFGKMKKKKKKKKISTVNRPSNIDKKINKLIDF